MNKITIVYYSQTGNVRRFVEKLDPAHFFVVPIGSFTPDGPYVLVSPTVGFGEVPVPVETFLRSIHARHMVGVAASGNRNWGPNYARAGHLIADAYGVPLLHTFEFSGLPADVEKFSEEAKALWRRLEL